MLNKLPNKGIPGQKAMVGKPMGAALGGKASAKPVTGNKVGSTMGAAVMAGKPKMPKKITRTTSTGYMTR